MDHTQFIPSDPHYDAKSMQKNPEWFMVDLKFVRLLKRFISLSELKALCRDKYKLPSDILEELTLFTSPKLKT